MRILLATLALIAGLSAAFAVQPDEILSDAALEARARGLSKELRCMVCQNQSIDDSDAPLARDLRVLVRERITAGDSDAQVLDFLTQRYGSFVLLKPRFTMETVLLWLAPIVGLLAGAAGLLIALRRRRRSSETADSGEPKLSALEQARVAEIMGQTKK